MISSRAAAIFAVAGLSVLFAAGATIFGLYTSEVAALDEACACLGLCLTVVDIAEAGLAFFTEDEVDWP